MSLRWTMESVWAMVAVVSSIGGGIYTNVYHSGASAAAVSSLQDHQKDQDAKIDANKQEVEDFKQHEAGVEQQLKDITTQLDRIEKKL